MTSKDQLLHKIIKYGYKYELTKSDDHKSRFDNYVNQYDNLIGGGKEYDDLLIKIGLKTNEKHAMAPIELKLSNMLTLANFKEPRNFVTKTINTCLSSTISIWNLVKSPVKDKKMIPMIVELFANKMIFDLDILQSIKILEMQKIPHSQISTIIDILLKTLNHKSYEEIKIIMSNCHGSLTKLFDSMVLNEWNYVETTKARVELRELFYQMNNMTSNHIDFIKSFISIDDNDLKNQLIQFKKYYDNLKL